MDADSQMKYYDVYAGTCEKVSFKAFNYHDDDDCSLISQHEH